jgi:protein-tyrosine-phosphatase
MKVLFLCGANINRSQIACAIFNAESKTGHATSAGMSVRPENDGAMIKDALNNPIIPMAKEGYDLSTARMRQLTPAMLKDADKVVLLRSKESLGGVLPSSLSGIHDIEWWDINSISDDTPFDEYCELEKGRIDRIKTLVDDLVKRIG